ncbi:MAG: hypothetical protein P8N49_05785 [Opitutales bacterium]|nr:hypothetical protein [Opitutales bacterium]
MLSSGTRIGPSRIISWLGDGSCGQSYECIETDGESKGEKVYAKLIHREISESKGFEDYFLQECQALEQLEGPGIWPIQKFGVMKWKHWIYYPWLQGHSMMIGKPSAHDEEDGGEEVLLRSLGDFLEHKPEEMNPDTLLGIMIFLHQAVHRAHLGGVVHGNLKPRNILVEWSGAGKVKAWITEFGLWKMNAFATIRQEETDTLGIFMNLDVQESVAAAAKFRPEGVSSTDIPDEKWDLCGLGQIVHWIVDKKGLRQDADWKEWMAWAVQAASVTGFPSVAHSMHALPGMGDIAQYGLKLEGENDSVKIDPEEVRAKRELEWSFQEKRDNLRFRRNMTAFVGGICLVVSLVSMAYNFFRPSPWTEYSIDGILDSYQLGAGIFSGQAWGIVPAAYDSDHKGGQDVVGEWEKEDGFLKLSFRKFKIKPNDEGDKKLWQYIGTGKTSPDDYHNWQDYLRFDRSREALILVKRVDDRNEYKPGRRGSDAPRLFPSERFSGKGAIKKAELAFINRSGKSLNWTFFFGIGFLLAASLYHRETKKIEAEQSGKD